MVGECAEERERVVLLARPRGLGDIAGHQHDRDPLAQLELRTRTANRIGATRGERFHVDAGEATVRPEMQVRELEQDERCHAPPHRR
jgi:hypothetical protein